MPQQKLTIVPVTLHPDSKNSLPATSSKGLEEGEQRSPIDYNFL